MSPETIELLPAALLATIIPSLLGIGSYALCRRAEKAWHGFPYCAVALLIFATLLCWFLGEDAPLLEVLGAMGILAFPGPWGGRFHLLLAGGASRHWSGAILLSIASIGFSFLGAVGLLTLHSTYPSPYTRFTTHLGLIYAYSLGAILYPTLAPLVFWVWRRWRGSPEMNVS
ncbi:hypothetical protein EON80_06735 [bacterium]|nr:MAG: hypothetical protein EON80_06735 [bacterium]